MKKISILGCGWLGLPIGKALAVAGYKVKGSTTQATKLEQLDKLGIVPYLINFRDDKTDVGDFFDSDILIITIPPSNADKPNEYFTQLEEIRRLSKEGTIKHTIFISSTSVYPNLQREVVEEDASYDARTRSGISLLRAEDLFRNVQNTIIRFAGLIGPNRHPGKWYAGKKQLSGGDTPVNMIHLEDCIGVIQRIIENDHWGETYNACAPEHPLKKDYYPRCATTLGLEVPSYKKEQSSNWKIVSSKKLMDETGYKFQKSIYDL